jgi:hypothetical protein
MAQQKGPTMADIPQRFDHTDDGFETARDGDFVSYDDYAALLARAKRAEARVRELEAEREEDHKNINIKADFIEAMISQSIYDHYRIKELKEALRLADAALGGANMNMPVIERKIKSALSREEPKP